MTQKVYFLSFMLVYCGLIILVACTYYLVLVSVILIGQQSLRNFFRYRPLLPIGWRTVQIVRQRRKEKMAQGTLVRQ
jgi:hypothetical protein